MRRQASIAEHCADATIVAPGSRDGHGIGRTLAAGGRLPRAVPLAESMTMDRLATMAATARTLIAGRFGGADGPEALVAREASAGGRKSGPVSAVVGACSARGGCRRFRRAATTVPSADRHASAPPPTAVATADFRKLTVDLTPLPDQVPVPDDSANAPVIIDAPAPELRAIDADAMRRTGKGIEDLAVIGAGAMVWADGCLGCPDPGAQYAMALASGYRARIAVPGDVTGHHASRRGQKVGCLAVRSIAALP